MGADTPGGRKAVNPWLIAIAVSIATFMEVLDTTIVTVALRYIAGGLSAAEGDSEWVITSYLAANASVLLLSGWLSAYFGRRNYYLASLAIFTAASAGCGFAWSLPVLILFRILQGLGGGGLQPVTQAVLVDSFPPEKQGAAQAMFGLSALIAPVVGPVLGGYISDNFGWEWIFFINIGPGIASLAINYAVLHDPDYLKEQRAELHRTRRRFDYIGLGLIVLAMTCMEVILSKGQEWDWFDDPFGRVQLLALGLVLGFLGIIVWERRHPAPVLNLAPFRDRNFALGGLAGYASYAMMYASAVLLPSMLQSLFGYNATWSGLVMSPAGVFAIVAITASGYLVGKQVDARWIIAGGACLIAAGSYWYSQLNIQVGSGQLVWPYVLEMVGISALFPPLSVAVFRYLPPELRGAAAGIFAAMRMEGGSLGTTLGKTIVARRLPLHTSRLGEHLNAFNPALREAGRSAQMLFYHLTGDPQGSQVLALKAIDNLRQQQAAAMSYLDAYWLFAVLALLIIPIALLMRKSRAEAGVHIAAH